ncbi:ABC transporter ATP-binding protein [Microvirga sp. 2MCAF38]|uniref:ABC transporter ATP-binding protein n=1 Tax=Microvirga sp. 2MCAF38 TaxID=3232989 RepID=UPI003F998EF5
MTFLSVQGIGKRYGATVALEGVDLNMSGGSRTAIVGPSGSGKTTLLRIIAGFETPDAGRVTLDGQVLAEGPSTVAAHLRGIGVVTQDGALFPHLSVADNIGFGLDPSAPSRDKRILELMDTVELDRKMLDRRPHEISGGQQQRVALARALARQPKLMLLDEPFSALDTGLRESTRKAVAEVLRAAGITTMLVTHDQVEALSFADQVAILREGRLVQAGSPRELYLTPKDPGTAVFIGDAIIMPAKLEDGWALCNLGRIAADTGQRRGAAEIMLRPEQVRLAPSLPEAQANDADPSACYGQVTDVEFGGAVCMVTLSLLSSPDAPLLRIRSSSIDLPNVGTYVKITVLGKAHVFDLRPSSSVSVR